MTRKHRIGLHVFKEKRERSKRKLTGGLVAETLADGTGVLEVNVPAGGLALGVLEGEAEDGLALLNGVFALLLALESGGDGVEGP